MRSYFCAPVLGLLWGVCPCASLLAQDSFLPLQRRQRERVPQKQRRSRQTSPPQEQTRHTACSTAEQCWPAFLQNIPH